MKVYRRALPKCLQKPWKTFIYWYLSDVSKHSFTENEWRQGWNNTTANWNVFPITIATCSDAHHSGERELSWLPSPIARDLFPKVVLKWLAFEQRKKFPMSGQFARLRQPHVNINQLQRRRWDQKVPPEFQHCGRDDNNRPNWCCFMFCNRCFAAAQFRTTTVCDETTSWFCLYCPVNSMPPSQSCLSPL